MGIQTLVRKGQKEVVDNSTVILTSLGVIEFLQLHIWQVRLR